MSHAPLFEGTRFSHGTMDSRVPEKTQRFLQEFLGIRSVRKSKMTQYVWCGGWWLIATLTVGPKVPSRQGEGFRFGLLVATPEEVDAAYRAAIEQQQKWEIQHVRPVRVDGDTRAFWLQDLDGNWWEIYHRPGHLYDDLFASHQSGAAGRSASA
jgi:catechol 2,3-dioxygenase-like lactoylglutathione lyase family enzyme